MGRKRPIITLKDEGSGRFVRAEILPERRGGKFMKIWQDTGWERRLGDLQGRSLLIMWRLVAGASWGNEVEGPGKIADEMGMKQSHVSRAYGELIKAGVLHRINGGYMLDPYFCWKGDDAQYEEACRRISMIKRKELTGHDILGKRE